MNLMIEGLFFVERTKTAVPAGAPTPSQLLNAFHPIGDRATRFLDSRSFQCAVPKGKFLLRKGQICPYIFMVRFGLVRGFVAEGKNEITTWIATDNELVSSSNFFDQSPALENIQALEDLTLIGLHYSDLEAAYARYPELNTAARLVLQQAYQQAEERSYLARLGKASSRYAYFQEKKPELVNRVPLKFIASYLGMTLETLSRLRTSLSKAYADGFEKRI